jgi:hypothetical protein
LEGLAMGDIVILYGHLVYILCGNLVNFVANGIFYGHLVKKFRFGMLCQKKSGNPD